MGALIAARALRGERLLPVRSKRGQGDRSQRGAGRLSDASMSLAYVGCGDHHRYGRVRLPRSDFRGIRFPRERRLALACSWPCCPESRHWSQGASMSLARRLGLGRPLPVHVWTSATPSRESLEAHSERFLRGEALSGHISGPFTCAFPAATCEYRSHIGSMVVHRWDRPLLKARSPACASPIRISPTPVQSAHMTLAPWVPTPAT